MPEVSTMRARADRAASDTSAEIAPSDFPLHLPSSLPAQTACLPALRQHEFRLREAQAYESLDELRDHLRLRTHMYKYKNKNIVGQRANTRCQNIISTVQDKANTSATKYRTARAAIVKLSPHCVDNEGWRGRLLPLAEEDIRALKEGEEGESEGRRSLSWIWRIVGVGGDSDDEGLQEGKPYQYFIISDTNLTYSLNQHFVSSGVGVVLEPCVGRRRSFFYVKRCEESWLSWNGMLDGGMSGKICSLNCQMCRKVWLHMPASRLPYDDPCEQHSNICGGVRMNLSS
jgi:hypothetical protein